MGGDSREKAAFATAEDIAEEVSGGDVGDGAVAERLRCDACIAYAAGACDGGWVCSCGCVDCERIRVGSKKPGTPAATGEGCVTGGVLGGISLIVEVEAFGFVAVNWEDVEEFDEDEGDRPW